VIVFLQLAMVLIECTLLKARVTDMGPSQGTGREHPEGTRRAVGAVRCPRCGTRRLQFGGDRENPWRCGECGASFRMPNDLPGRESEHNPVQPARDASLNMGGRAQRPGTWAGGLHPGYRGESDASLSPPDAWLTVLAWPVRLAMAVTGLLAIVLGAHGLYVYLNSVDGVLRTDRDTSDLFLAVDVPSQLVGIVNWCSVMALGSWAVPVSLVFGGVLLLWIRERW